MHVHRTTPSDRSIHVDQRMRHFPINIKPTLSMVQFHPATGGARVGTSATVSFDLAAHPAFTLEAKVKREAHPGRTTYVVTVNAGALRQPRPTLPADTLKKFEVGVGFGRITVRFEDIDGHKMLERRFNSIPPA